MNLLDFVGRQASPSRASLYKILAIVCVAAGGIVTICMILQQLGAWILAPTNLTNFLQPLLTVLIIVVSCFAILCVFSGALVQIGLHCCAKDRYPCCVPLGPPMDSMSADGDTFQGEISPPSDDRDAPKHLI